MRVQFEQAIATGFEFGINDRSTFRGLGDQCSHADGVNQGVTQRVAQLGIHSRCGGADMFEAVQSVSIPFHEYFAGGIFEIGDVQFDGPSLTDPVQASDALFE